MTLWCFISLQNLMFYFYNSLDFQTPKYHQCFNKCCELTQLSLVYITRHYLNLTGEAGVLHAKNHWFFNADPLLGEIKKLLNSAIANNRPSLLKLQQALIGFKVMKKTTWSIIIKVWCRHVRAQALRCEWWGRASSTGARSGPCPWGNHPSSNINISEAAVPEAFILISKYSYD